MNYWDIGIGVIILLVLVNSLAFMFGKDVIGMHAKYFRTAHKDPMLWIVLTICTLTYANAYFNLKNKENKQVTSQKTEEKKN